MSTQDTAAVTEQHSFVEMQRRPVVPIGTTMLDGSQAVAALEDAEVATWCQDCGLPLDENSRSTLCTGEWPAEVEEDCG